MAHSRQQLRPRQIIALGSFLAIGASLGPWAGPSCGQENPYVVGEFAVTFVVDGDTIAVEGLESTIRFLCIDTEECEKGPGAAERSRSLEDNFDVYARDHVREDPLGQFNTPMGWKGKEFAETWFPAGSRVRLEYDHLSRKTDYHSRVLAYVFAERDGRWVNYNIECVRAGMSPYFDKYGRSERFESEFIAAEREARIHGRGIWSPYAMAYPNYHERLALWWRRSQTLTQFEEKYSKQPNAFYLLDEEGWQRLSSLRGQEVLLLSDVKRIQRDPDTPPSLELHHKEFERVALQFSDSELRETAEAFIAAYNEDFLYFKGILAPAAAELDQEIYRHTLIVSRREDIYLEMPGQAMERRFPEPYIKITGDRISWKTAGRHINEEVAVVGRIVRANNIGIITFLNFHHDYRNTLTVVIKEQNYHRFPTPPEESYKNRTVLVRGKVTEHDGAPQIEVTDPGQIEILE